MKAVRYLDTASLPEPALAGSQSLQEGRVSRSRHHAGAEQAVQHCQAIYVLGAMPKRTIVHARVTSFESFESSSPGGGASASRMFGKDYSSSDDSSTKGVAVSVRDVASISFSRPYPFKYEFAKYRNRTATCSALSVPEGATSPSCPQCACSLLRRVATPHLTVRQHRFNKLVKLTLPHLLSR